MKRMRFVLVGKNSFVAVFLLAACVFQSEGFAQVAGYGAIPSVDEVSEGGGAGAAGGTKKTEGRSVKTTSNKAATDKRRTTKRAPAKPTTAKSRPSSKPYDGFVVGDKYTFLNFEVVSGPNPLHTIAAKKAGADGLVQVEVLIDVNGTVLSAKARTGNKLLWPEAERAALETVFNKPNVYGKPARAVGFLVYRFGKSREE